MQLHSLGRAADALVWNGPLTPLLLPLGEVRLRRGHPKQALAAIDGALDEATRPSLPGGYASGLKR